MYIFNSFSDTSHLSRNWSVMAAAAPQLTDWEKRQIKDIDLILRNAQIKNAEFNRVHMLLNEGNNGITVENETLRFRSFLSDLYSVLDYMCYLLHCHYKNEGNEAFSSESRNVKFPFKTNLKKFPEGNSDEDPERAHQKRRNDWIRQQCELIFGVDNQPGKEYFKHLIERIQPVMYVNADGDPIDPSEAPEIEGDARSFSLLHFYRNYSTHRDLVHLYRDVGVLSIDLITGERQFAPKGHQQPSEEKHHQNVQRIDIARGFWVEIPDLRRFNQDRGIQPTTPEPLLIVASWLLSFVRNVRDGLLNATLKAPSYTHDVAGVFADGLHIDFEVHNWQDYDRILMRIVH